MTDLSTNDPEFYDHMKTIAKIRTKVNPKVITKNNFLKTKLKSIFYS